MVRYFKTALVICPSFSLIIASLPVPAAEITFSRCLVSWSDLDPETKHSDASRKYEVRVERNVLKKSKLTKLSFENGVYLEFQLGYSQEEVLSLEAGLYKKIETRSQREGAKVNKTTSVDILDLGFAVSDLSHVGRRDIDPPPSLITDILLSNNALLNEIGSKRLKDRGSLFPRPDELLELIRDYNLDIPRSEVTSVLIECVLNR